MNATGQYTKRALIRDDSYPVGVPAPLHLNCECGARVEMTETIVNDEGWKPGLILNPATCVCGIKYNGAGYILSRPTTEVPCL